MENEMPGALSMDYSVAKTKTEISLQFKQQPVLCPYRQPVQMIENTISGQKIVIQERMCGSWCALFEFMEAGAIGHVKQHCCQRSITFANFE